MLITAPDAPAEPTGHAFECLRRLRARFQEPDVSKDPQWDGTVDAVSEAIAELMGKMREDLSSRP
jgi:hypothetical protein